VPTIKPKLFKNYKQKANGITEPKTIKIWLNKITPASRRAKYKELRQKGFTVKDARQKREWKNF
jgi:hypothetical protein